MAIQDDNTILKKSDLKAYHEAIAPMLGGTFMVRTNNSDYYSTDEKIVGVWTDGKPLYQKTFVGSMVTDGSNIVQADSTGTFQFKNIKACLCYSDVGTIQESTFFYAGDNYWSVWVEGGYIKGKASESSYAGKTVNVILQYTKTTDTASTALTTPGAYDINFPNTWPANKEIFFGNGLYGQRFTGTIATTTTVQDFTLTTLPSTTILVNVGGILKRHVMGASYYDFAIPYNYENIMGASIAIDVGVLKFIVKNSGTGNVPYDVWVTYTK